ncbi:MAG: SGNH/GDSL hydrolase family protein [Clostridia bacterium]|nr:SGNH/GDSL hydrolase family protein [Clostridia bacterium]
MKNSIYQIIIALLAGTMVIGAVLCWYFVSNKIAFLNNRISNLEKLLAEKPGAEDTAKTADNGEEVFRYLAIGNSITWHVKCDYWWNECGMAASVAEKDYVHVVAQNLEEKHGRMEFAAYNFSKWEITPNDRFQTLQLIDDLLRPDLNLITVQLSENVTEKATLEEDFRELVNYIKNKCPDADIVVVDDYYNSEYSAMKKRVAEERGVKFADLSAIRGNAEYTVGMGTTVYGSDGTPHKIEHLGVSGHPGDKGMKYIANAIIGCLAG